MVQINTLIGRVSEYAKKLTEKTLSKERLTALTGKARTSIKGLYEKGALHIVAGQFIFKFVSLFSSIFLVRLLSKSDYGVLGYIDTFYGYFVAMIGLGFANAITRYVILGKDVREKYGYYRFSVVTGSIANVVILVIVMILNPFYNHPSSYVDYAWLIVVMIAVVPFNFIIICSQDVQRAFFDTKIYAINCCVTSVLWLVFRYVGGAVGNASGSGVVGVVFGALLIEIVMAGLLILYTKRRYFSGVEYVRPERSVRRAMLSYSVQYMLTNSLWLFFALNDAFLIGRMCDDPTILADYKVAHVLPANLAIFSTCIGLFISPYFTKHHHAGDYEWVRKSWIKTLLVSIALNGAAALVLFIFAKPLIVYIYGAQYVNTVPIMRVMLIASCINNSLRYPTANALASMGIIRYNLTFSAISVALQIGLDIYAIRVVGGHAAMGVAYVSIVVYIILTVLLTLVFLRLFFRPSPPAVEHDGTEIAA